MLDLVREVVTSRKRSLQGYIAWRRTVSLDNVSHGLTPCGLIVAAATNIAVCLGTQRGLRQEQHHLSR
jgi:hypothetical protein